ncbi:DUF397 domain-containing protein [Streptomyces sp. NPDC047071]|uniref:DUF397 domain-containing protein n=1 Tax=Streptomyces sp. NPDC047071 TaxID=3154808 RepID=UPI003453F73E
MAGVFVGPERRKFWRKSSYSSEKSGCVEVLWASRMHVRDSQRPESGQIAFSGDAWAAFVSSLLGTPSAHR